jgi:hypothetical protein
LRNRSGARLRSLVLAVATGFAAAPAAPLSLGTPDVASFLGQPLQLRVPVVLDDPADGSAQCLRIISQPGGDVPTLSLARIDVERGVTGAFLRVSTPQPVDEPVLRVVLEIGCTQRVRREFTLLLDPPIVTAGANVGGQSTPEIEFGMPQVVGTRGQPLLVNVPLYGELVPSLTSACVRTGRGDAAELPRVLNDARVTLAERDGARWLRIQTPEPVNDARVRVIVEVGCEKLLQREFLLQVEEPRLAETPAEASAAAPAKPTPKPVARASAPRPTPPAKPPVVPVLPPAPAQVPLAQQAEPPRIEPAQLPPREPAGKTDRLVLSAPEDAPRQVGPGERDAEVLKRVDELSAEIKRLRTELDAAAVRNRELAAQANSTSYAWAVAAGASVLLAVAIMFGWRSRPRNQEATRTDTDRAGPITRILGKSVEKASGPMLPKFSDGAGPATIAAIAAAHRAHEQDTHGASGAIMVTEFRDTTQVIGELYSPYIEKGPATQPGRATQPGPQTKTEIALDLDLGQERTTTVYSPQTRTEISVDIDVFERNSQIGRDLQREYERLDLAASAKAAADKPKKEPEPDPTTLMGGTTMPMTTKLALDLDLDLPTISQPKKGLPKPE